MSKDNKLEQYLCDHLAFSLVGKLTSGIVHNLNGPLQILSMQIELFSREIDKEILDLQTIEKELTNDQQKSLINNLIDKLQKRYERIKQLEITINKMEDIINVIAKRCRSSETINNTVFVNQIIEEELLFWQGDLFFKHNVEKHVKLSNTPIFLQTDETKLRVIIDLMLAASIISIKDLDSPTLTITTDVNDDCIIVEIRQSGKKFNRIDDDNISISDILINTDIDDYLTLEQCILLHSVKYLSKDINSNITITDHSLVLKLFKE